MAQEAPAAILRSIWTALREPEEPSRLIDAQSKIERMIEEGHAPLYQVSDMIEDCDERLRGRKVEALASLFQIPTRTFFNVSGRKTQRGYSGSERMAVADVASLFISLERLGFSTDPTPFVDALLPLIPKKGLLTNSELDILNFHKCRFRMDALTFLAPKGTPPARVYEERRTSTGVRIEASVTEDGTPTVITFFDPKYRRPPKTETVTCPVCLSTYVKGDPEESARHRREHKRVLTMVEPKPYPLAAEAVSRGWDGFVDPGSPRWMQKAMLGRARLFRREFGYDFLQWHSIGEQDPRSRGFLFMDDEQPGRIVGACSFFWREYTDAPHAWALQWIWIAPVGRRQGHLSRHWAMFREKFGQFAVEQPLSDAMQDFLKARGVNHLNEEAA
jgi:hypothetical protein